MCFFTETYLWPSQQSLHDRHPHFNEIAVADTDEVYSNTQDGTSCKNSNAMDLWTAFAKSPTPEI